MLVLKIIKYVLTFWMHGSRHENNTLLCIKFIECAHITRAKQKNPVQSLLEKGGEDHEILAILEKTVNKILKKDNMNVFEYNWEYFRKFISVQAAFKSEMGRYLGSKYDDDLYKLAYVVFLYKQNRHVEFESEFKDSIEKICAIHLKIYKNNINPEKKDLFFKNFCKPNELFQKTFNTFIYEIHKSLICNSEFFRILFEPFITNTTNEVSIFMEIEQKKRCNFYFSFNLKLTYEEYIYESKLSYSNEKTKNMLKLMERIDQNLKFKLEEIIAEKGDYCIVEIKPTIADISEGFKLDLLKLCEQNEFLVFFKFFSKIFHLSEDETKHFLSSNTIGVRNNKLDSFLKAVKTQDKIKALREHLTIRKSEVAYIRSLYFNVGIERKQTTMAYCNLGVSLIFKIIIEFWGQRLHLITHFLKMHLVKKLKETGQKPGSIILANAAIENINFENYIYDKKILNHYEGYFNIVCNQLKYARIQVISIKIRKQKKYTIDAFIEDILPNFFSEEEKTFIRRSLFTVVFDNLNITSNNRHVYGTLLVQTEIMNNHFYQVCKSNGKDIECGKCDRLDDCEICKICIGCCQCE